MPIHSNSTSPGATARVEFETLSSGEITKLLEAWSRGESDASERLIQEVYSHLRRLAEIYLARNAAEVSLQPTELLHELFLKLEGRRETFVFETRAHFFGFASRLLRNLIVDFARSRSRAKRGGGLARVDLDLATPEQQVAPEIILAVDQALSDLMDLNPVAARVVEVRFFAGLTLDETAVALEIGRATVARKWRFARAWLQRELESQNEP